MYRTFYKLLGMHIRCSTVALSNVLQRKMLAWLRARGESRAADWLEEYWTGNRGNWTLAHGGVGGTHKNNGTEGRWKGFKSAVAGTSGSCASDNDVSAPRQQGTVFVLAQRYTCTYADFYSIIQVSCDAKAHCPDMGTRRELTQVGAGSLCSVWATR